MTELANTPAHWETFRADAGRLRDGEGLPAFVEDEFRSFLRCGWLAVVGTFLRAVFATLRRRATWDGIAGGRSGAVAILQRGPRD